MPTPLLVPEPAAPEPLRLQMSDPATVAMHCRQLLGDPDREEFTVLALDVRNRLLQARVLFTGSADRCTAHPREVFRFLVQAGPCCRFIVAHNHPSGDPSPSPADLDITRRLKEAGLMMDIELLDHVVYTAGNRFLSFRETGRL